jgi:branched-chain amino acid transport system substrate-binding protein
MLRRTALLISAIMILGGPASPTAAADNPIEINVIVSLTGGAAFLGKNEATALQLVEQNTNKTGGIGGRPVHFVIADDQTNPQIAVQLASDLIAKKVPIILGPTLTAGCNAVSALIKGDGPVLYCFTPGSHPVAGSYTFVYGISTFDLMAVNVRYFHDLGYKKVAMLSTTDASGQDGDASLDAALKRPEFRDMTLVASEHYGVTDQTVVAQLARIKASGAQAMFAWGSGSPIGTVYHGLSDAGPDIPVGTTAANMIYPLMKQYASILPPGLVAAGNPSITLDSLPPGPLKDAVRLYVNSFKAQGVDADVSQAIAWDPALIVVSAFKKLGAGATAAQIKAYISDLHGFSGANGTYDFRDGSQRGLVAANGIMVKWDAGRNAWDAVSKFGGAPLNK